MKNTLKISAVTSSFVFVAYLIPGLLRPFGSQLITDINTYVTMGFVWLIFTGFLVLAATGTE